MPQFDIITFPSQVFWLLFSLVVLCIAMIWHLVPRLMTVFERRTEHLTKNWQETENIKNQIHLLKSENLKQLKTVKAQAYCLISKAVAESQTIKSSRLKTLEDKMAKKLTKAQSHLAKDKKIVDNNITVLVSQVVLETISCISGHTFTELQVNELVQVTLKKVRDQYHQERL